MTYLNIVNQVMRRLREEEVATVNESDYSKMIGDFVNDAKRLVEDAWDWTGLRTTHTITTVVGTPTYSLTGFGVRSKITSIHNETDNNVVRLESLARIREQNLGTDNANGVINYYAVDGVDSNNDIKIRLYQTPNAVKTLTVYGVKRTADLIDDADEVLIPSHVIVQWAYAYALRERGETGGESGAEQAIFAKNDMATAISLDAGYHPEETIWETV
jgi:hypothetical protein